MRSLRLFAISLSAFVLMTGSAARASAEADWQKSYPVFGKPSISLSTGDTSVEVRPCSACREVRVRVEWNDRYPSEYVLSEFQAGDHVTFEVKEKSRFGIHITTGSRHEPHVTVETPSTADLEARTTDGSLRVSGIQGNVELKTGDGSVEVSDVSGALRLTASDGSIRIHNVIGTLESRSSDGSVSIHGQFTALHVHSGDGRLDVTLADGSRLTSSSRIESSDGQVTIHLPRTLAADLEVHTSDGKIKCELPLTMNGYNSTSSSGHNLRGHLNSGGLPLTIQTSDGNATIAAL
jgi:DUF4097 and DUF4098 domain-containing protein YvlB